MSQWFFDPLLPGGQQLGTPSPIVIAVPVGSLAVTGSAPTVSVSIQIPVPVGSLAVTGYAPTVTIGSTIAVPVGSLTLAGKAPPTVLQPSSYGLQLVGYAPTAGISHVISVPTGTLTLTGLAPVVAVSISIPVPLGTAVLAGKIPTLVLVDNHIRAPPVGALTATGLQPTLQSSYTAQPGTGTLSLTGAVPAANISLFIDVPVGSLTLSGSVPTATNSGDGNLTVQPGTGSLTLQGYAPPTVLQPSSFGLQLVGYAPTATNSGDGSQTALPDAGSLSVAGYAPSVFVDNLVTVPVGSLTLAGYAPPTVLQPSSFGLQLVGYAPTATNSGDGNKTALPGTGSLAITGYAPTALNNFVATPAAGSLAVSGSIPTLSYSWVIPVPKGGLTALGYAPTVSVTSGSALPGVGSLTITGYEPVVDVTGDGVIPVPTGSLTATGYAPPTVNQPSSFGLQLVGYVPTITVGAGANNHTRTPGTGSLTITGESPALNIVINNAASSLYFTGFAPTVTVTPKIFIQVPKGGLTALGYEPLITIPQNSHGVQPGLGILSVTGHAPTVYLSQYFPSTGTLTLEGYDPLLIEGEVVLPGTGSLSVTGYAPGVFENLQQPGAGSLLVQGYAPTIVNTSEVVVSRAGGRSSRKRYVVEVDGELIQVATQADVLAILQQAAEIATEQIEVIPPPKIRVRTSAGKPVESKAIVAAVKQTQRRISQAYVEAKKRREVDREISALLFKAIERQDEEDDIITILVS